ncbi:hypothetical protein PAXINDRAFT_17275 [Paxillus involutus ATCC 200175]|uniref:Uncharacterized protein n=1 Tax=Paxillus involutus ATCC 200175 TaxID=664439 RepID=A0A0C9TFM0_PAXIN|nr:hypothetical protein PAXINDRAFT_17275 [Paxillus involutus ATCC 200175]
MTCQHAEWHIRAKWRSHTRNGATDSTSTADGPKTTDPQAHKDVKWCVWTPENPPTGPKAHKDAKRPRKDPVPSPRAMSVPNGPRRPHVDAAWPNPFPEAYKHAKRPTHLATEQRALSPRAHERAKRAMSTRHRRHMAHPFPQAFEHAKQARHGPIPSPRLTSTLNAHHNPRRNHDLKNGATTSKRTQLPQNGSRHLKIGPDVGNQSSLRVQHRSTTHPITPARTQRPTHEGSIRPRAYPIRPGLSLSFTDPHVRPRTARSAHALVRLVLSSLGSAPHRPDSTRARLVNLGPLALPLSSFCLDFLPSFFTFARLTIEPPLLFTREEEETYPPTFVLTASLKGRTIRPTPSFSGLVFLLD